MGALASRRPTRRPGLSAVFSTRTCGPVLTGWTFQSSLGIEADTLFPRANLVSVVFVPSRGGRFRLASSTQGFFPAAGV